MRLLRPYLVLGITATHSCSSVVLMLFHHNSSSAPIVIHCRSGRRAVKAKEVLKSHGYENVANAGGLHDLREHDK